MGARSAGPMAGPPRSALDGLLALRRALSVHTEGRRPDGHPAAVSPRCAACPRRPPRRAVRPGQAADGNRSPAKAKGCLQGPAGTPQGTPWSGTHPHQVEDDADVLVLGALGKRGRLPPAVRARVQRQLGGVRLVRVVAVADEALLAPPARRASRAPRAARAAALAPALLAALPAGRVRPDAAVRGHVDDGRVQGVLEAVVVHRPVHGRCICRRERRDIKQTAGSAHASASARGIEGRQPETLAGSADGLPRYSRALGEA